MSFFFSLFEFLSFVTLWVFEFSQLDFLSSPPGWWPTSGHPASNPLRSLQFCIIFCSDIHSGTEHTWILPSGKVHLFSYFWRRFKWLLGRQSNNEILKTGSSNDTEPINIADVCRFKIWLTLRKVLTVCIRTNF